MSDDLILTKKHELITFLVRLGWRSKDEDMSKRAFRFLNHLFFYGDLITVDYADLETMPPAILISVVEHAELVGVVSKTKANKLMRLARRKLRDRDFGDVDVTSLPKHRRRKEVEGNEELTVEDKDAEFVEKVRQRRKYKRKRKRK